MSQVDEAVLDLTVSEASLLADVLGVAPPPGLVDPDDEVVAAGAGAVGAEGGAVAPGLVERRILDAEGTVAAPVADLLTVVGSPHLVARAVHEVNGVAETRSFAARPEMAVEQRGLAGDLVRFTPFHPRELVGRIMAFVSAGQTAEVERLNDAQKARSFECPVLAIDELFASAQGDSAAPNGDRLAILSEAGVDAEIAELFVAAADNAQSTNSVTVLHRPTEHEIVGVDLTWLDGGEHGLWLTEPSDQGPEWRLIEQIQPMNLAEKLTAFLPFG